MTTRGNRIMFLINTRELALMQRIQSGDYDARQALITSNLRQVLHNQGRNPQTGAGIFDLIKAGNTGLDHAMKNFSPARDGQFSAHAATCIRRHIERALNPDRASTDGANQVPARRALQAQCA